MGPQIDSAKAAADAHYDKLFEVFLNTIPEEFRRKGELAPSSKRCAGFTTEDTFYRFGVDFGAHLVNVIGIVAVFRFSKTKNLWEFSTFTCYNGMPPPFSSTYSVKSLVHAIILANEMYQQQMKAIQTMTTPTMDTSVPVGKPN